VPELPEVETVVRDLRPHLAGCRIASVEVGTKKLRRPWSFAWNTLLVGQTIRDVRRRGKWIVMALEAPQTLLAHLGMTGQLTVAPATEPRANHTHVVLGLDGAGKELRFRDSRRFGSMTLFPDEASLERFFEAARLGPEPFDLDAKTWPPRIAETKRCLKAVLLDQRVVSGVGNIYADEVLWLRGCTQPGRANPDASRGRPAASRDGRCADAGDRAARSTIRDYVGGSGLRAAIRRSSASTAGPASPAAAVEPRSSRPAWRAGRVTTVRSANPRESDE
jgi:formamidopyrimidine-DNA glycosylase